MTGNRAVVYSGPRAVKVEKVDYPKLVDPRGKKCDHGVIVKLVTSNICGSDLHIDRERFVAPEGMVLGHENTGEVVETGRDVTFMRRATWSPRTTCPPGSTAATRLGSGQGRRWTSPVRGRWAVAPPRARLVGASCIIVGDRKRQRLELVIGAGFEVVNLSKDVPLADQIEAILGAREVDCVGFGAHGYGPDAAKDRPEAVHNALISVVRSGGGFGIPGVYTDNDPGAPTPQTKKGRLGIEL